MQIPRNLYTILMSAFVGSLTIALIVVLVVMVRNNHPSSIVRVKPNSSSVTVTVVATKTTSAIETPSPGASDSGTGTPEPTTTSSSGGSGSGQSTQNGGGSRPAAPTNTPQPTPTTDPRPPVFGIYTPSTPDVCGNSQTVGSYSSFIISNNGGGTLQWQVTSVQYFNNFNPTYGVFATPSSGSLGPGQTVQINVKQIGTAAASLPPAQALADRPGTTLFASRPPIAGSTGSPYFIIFIATNDAATNYNGVRYDCI